MEKRRVPYYSRLPAQRVPLSRDSPVVWPCAGESAPEVNMGGRISLFTTLRVLQPLLSARLGLADRRVLHVEMVRDLGRRMVSLGT